MTTTIAASGAVHHRSCDHEAIADVELVELEQVGVALVPGPGVEVGRQPGQPLVDQRRVEQAEGEGRDRGPHTGIEVGLGPTPVRGEEAVGAVGWDRQLDDARPRQGLGDLRGVG